MLPRFLKQRSQTVAAVLALFLFFFFYILLFRAPGDFPVGKVVVISQGMSVSEAGDLLEENDFVASSGMFSLLAALLSGDKIIAGGYFFEKRLSVFSVASRITSGNFNVGLSKITFPEGMTIAHMAKHCAKILPGCIETEFLAAAKKKEGYLFPDTYFFQPGVSAPEVVAKLEETFNRKIIEVNPSIAKFGKPLPEIVTMASILEGEARDLRERRIIAGILWNRLEIDMPLQVDVAFDYILGKTTFELTSADLKYESPYNTYINKGLPPTPISNPGLEAIKAAATPITTPYYYYLTGHDGNFYYAKTFAEHVRNKERYLR